jgi:hypothetical protein
MCGGFTALCRSALVVLLFKLCVTLGQSCRHPREELEELEDGVVFLAEHELAG